MKSHLLFFLLPLMACFPEIEISPDLGAQDHDYDGDGLSETQGDCNDADPEITPDAQEGWYDGIDADCDGESDYDADSDGYDHDAHGGGDCDDSDPAVHPTASDAWYDGTDSDCDGADDYDADADGYDRDVDCDESDASVNPGATEIWYDAVDGDCDGSSDLDADSDGYDHESHGGADCFEGTDADTDPNDANIDAAEINPDATESWYDGTDADCDDTSDYDADSDGFEHEAHGGVDCWEGTAADSDTNPAGLDPIEINPDATDVWYDGTDADCDGASDHDYDGDGYDAEDYSGSTGDLLDCDDEDATINPGVTDIWYDGIDSDCDGANDMDADADGHDSDVYGGTDCDDAVSTTNPDATDVWYDGVDADCDGSSDNDADGDGYDHEAHGGTDCFEGTSSDADTNAAGLAATAIYPDAAEIWYDGTDADCNDDSDYDADHDGHDHEAYGGGDCYEQTSADTDSNPAGLYATAINPSATETWYDGTDADCDDASDYDADADGHDSDVYGGTDCDDAVSTTNPDATDVWYDGTDADCDGASDYDYDGDGYDAEEHGGDDCRDTDPEMYPDAPEYCDSEDDDCDGDVDESGAVDPATWYLDSDSDGYGDSSATVEACDAPAGYVEDDTDCDDNDDGVNPGETEECDDLDTDEDCDGYADDNDPESADGATIWYHDEDGDGYGENTGTDAYLAYGDDDGTVTTCDESSTYTATVSGDCHDEDNSINPGATEIWYDGDDSDCDQANDYDADGDGYDAEDAGGEDCDDTDATQYADCEGITIIFEDDFEGGTHGAEIVSNNGWSCPHGGCTTTYSTEQAHDGVMSAFTDQGGGEIGYTGEALSSDFTLIGWFYDTGVGGSNLMMRITDPGSDCVIAEAGWIASDSSTHYVASCDSDSFASSCTGNSALIPIKEGWHEVRFHASFTSAGSETDVCIDGSCLSHSGDVLSSVCTEATYFYFNDDGTAGYFDDIIAYTTTGDVDLDGDGYIDMAAGGTDCDDGNADVNPSAEESCGDSYDSNCDGTQEATVPGHHDTIQAAVSNASDGGLICVDSGTYYENIDIEGKLIHLYGIEGAHSTIIDGSGTAPVFTLSSGETLDTIIEGFTITNGSTDDGGARGGGLRIWNAAATVSNVIISNNSASSEGGGISLQSGDLEISNALVVDNDSSSGAGIFAFDGSYIKMENVIVARNAASAYGGGMCFTASTADLNNVSIIANTASSSYYGGGLYFSSTSSSGATISVTNSDFSGNEAGTGGGFYSPDSSPSLELSYSNVYENTPNDYDGSQGFSGPTASTSLLSVDPDYRNIAASDPLDWDLRLSENSALIDIGDTSILDPDDSTSDIGAFGGDGADLWDLDGDGYASWWQPGGYISPDDMAAGWDCDDSDSDRYPTATETWAEIIDDNCDSYAATAEIFSDDFESGSAGSELENVDTWVCPSTSTCDATYSDTVTYSGDQSAYMSTDGGDIGQEGTAFGGDFVIEYWFYEPDATSTSNFFLRLLDSSDSDTHFLGLVSTGDLYYSDCDGVYCLFDRSDSYPLSDRSAGWHRAWLAVDYDSTDSGTVQGCIDDDCSEAVSFSGTTFYAVQFVDDGTQGYVDDIVAYNVISDGDGDGYFDETYGGEDCDDDDASVSPVAAEVLDGVDNDCDGTIDGFEYPLSNAEIKFVGENVGDYAGGSVSNAGDVDGNGFDDIIVGAEYEGSSTAGAAYLVLGPISDSIDLSAADAKFTGANGDDHAGFSVSSAGDMDSSGSDDIIVGAIYEDSGGSDAGAAYLLLGPFSGGTNLSTAAAAMLIGEDGFDHAGESVSNAGDVNGDGRLDVMVGARGDDSGGSDAGAAYLLLGPVSGNIDLSAADAKLIGENGSDYAGRTVSDAGDVDGDGRADIMVGTHDNDSGAGAAYLLLGPVSGNIDLSAADAKLIGENSGDYAGESVSDAGDIDGDGHPDIVVGAHGDDSAGSEAGAAYVLLGPISGSIELSTSDAKLTGENSGDHISYSALSGAGDVDGDGRADLIIGAYAEGSGGSEAGAAYLLLSTGF